MRNRIKIFSRLALAWLCIQSVEAKIPCHESVRKLAMDLYSDRMPYHNFQHALDVVAAAREIYDRMSSEGISPLPDWDVLFFAALLHDAGYHEDHKQRGFPHKEAYSAHLAVELLNALGMPDEKVLMVRDAILATHRESPLESLEQKILRAADLKGLADSHENFMKKNEDLRREFQILNGIYPYSLDWAEMVVATIEVYLRPHIRLTSQYLDFDGSSRWHNRVRDNVTKFLQNR